MSSSRIYRNYNFDEDNAVVIDPTMVLPPIVEEDLLGDTELGEDGEEPEISPEEQARNLLDAARAEAEQIILDANAAGIAEQEAMRLAAKKEIDILAERAKSDGYQEGIAEAVREGDEIRAVARQVLEDAEKWKSDMQAALEPEMIDLLVGITNKLIGNAVIFNPGVILALVRSGMQNATIAKKVTIYVGAEDYDTVVAHRDEIAALTDGSVKLEIVKDLSLSKADCIIETPFGLIDASLGQQLEALKQNISLLCTR